MTFQDPSQNQPQASTNAQPDPSQPLTLDRPQTDPRLAPPYSPHQASANAQPRALPSALFISNTSRPPVDPADWGGDHAPIQAMSMYPGLPEGPDVPSGFESYPTIARGAGYAAKWGSDNINQQAGRVSGLAMAFAPLLDMLSKGGFSRGFNASSLNSIKVQQQNLILQGEELQYRHAQEMSDYGSIIAKADSLVKEHPERAAQIIEDAREELRFLADAKYRHHPLVAVIDSSGGLDAAKNFLNQEHAQFLDYWSGLASLKKVAGTEDAAKEAEEWGEPRPAGGTGGGGFRPLDTPEERAEEGGGPRAPDTPERVSKDAAGDFNARLARNMKLSPQEMRAIDQEVASGKPGPDIAAVKSPDIKRKVGLGVAAKNAEIDRIAGDKNLSPENKLAQISGVNPAKGTRLAAIGDYTVDPEKERIENRGRDIDLAKQIFGNKYNEAFFKKASAMYDTDKIEGKTLFRLANISQNWVNLMDSLNKVGENHTVTQAQIESWIASHFSGDEKWDVVFSNLRNLAVSLNGVQTMSGQVRVTLINELLRNLPKTASPRSVRAQLLPDLQDAFAVVNSFQDSWEGFGKRSLAPNMTPEGYGTMRAIVRMNPLTGEVPADSPPELKAVGGSKDKAYRGLKDAEKWTPYTMDQRRKLRANIAQYEHDPDPDKRAQAEEANRMLGGTMGLDRFVPGVDDRTGNAPRR